MIVCLLFVFVYFILLFLNERLAIEKADSDVF